MGCGVFLVAIVVSGVVSGYASPGDYSRAYLPTSPAFTHQTGFAVGTSWQTNVQQPSNAFLCIGPSATDAPQSIDLLVQFSLAVDNNSADDFQLLDLTVLDASSGKLLANTTVRRSDFETAGAFQNISLFVTTPSSPAELEYRAYYRCCSEITLSLITVRSLSDEGPMAPFWNDTAQWEFVSKAVFPSPDGEFAANVGFHFVPVGDTWYLFHRQYSFGVSPPAYCKADFARIVVTLSTDRGLSWLNETVIASPEAGTPYECALVDGAGFWDADVGAWFYLSQCLDRTETWALCAFRRDAADPRGPFSALPVQPSVKGGQLWSQICSGPAKHCQPTMAEEGTPEIVYKDADGYYYVTFHGWDPAHDASARGVAKTKDFATWLVTGKSLPGDAMFTSIDCNRWDIAWAPGGCVGGGEGSIVASGDYMYQLIEAPDLTLGCETAPGVQNWVLGLSRAPAFEFLATGLWHDFSVVPTVVPIVKQGCYIQYHRLFTDASGSIFLTFWADNWLQVHVLAPGAGALPVIAGPPPAVRVAATAGHTPLATAPL